MYRVQSDLEYTLSDEEILPATPTDSPPPLPIIFEEAKFELLLSP